MIFGIGTDIVEYARIEALWARYGEHFAERVLSARELAEHRSNSNMPRLLGMRHPVSLRRISVTHDGLGKPVLQFDEVLRTHLAQLGINGHHLSISDERDMIVAFVVLESN